MVGIIILLVLAVGIRLKDMPISLIDEAMAAEPTLDVEPLPAPLRAMEQQIGQQQSVLSAVDQQRQSLEDQLRTAQEAAAKQTEENRQISQQVGRAEQSQ